MGRAGHDVRDLATRKSRTTADEPDSTGGHSGTPSNRTAAGAATDAGVRPHLPLSDRLLVQAVDIPVLQVLLSTQLRSASTGFQSHHTLIIDPHQACHQQLPSPCCSCTQATSRFTATLCCGGPRQAPCVAVSAWSRGAHDVSLGRCVPRAAPRPARQHGWFGGRPSAGGFDAVEGAGTTM